MFDFRTLGSVSLAGPDGPVSGPAAQRRRLAVLALLSLAPEGTASRDWIVGQLWGETTQGKGRHLLSSSLYALRKALGDGCILSIGDEDLRLDPDVVWVDAAAFLDALEANDLEAAVSLYRGDFLAGFHVSGATGFGDWVSEERRRLSSLCGAALEELAEAAAARGDLKTSARWWERRMRLDPFDSRVAHALAEALAASGNQAAALKHARLHKERLHQELGLELPPEMVRLVRMLRGRSQEPPSTERQPARDGPAREDARPESAVRDQPVTAGPHRPSPVLRRAVLAAATLLAIGLTASVAAWIGGAQGPAHPSVAVLPLQEVGAGSTDELVSMGFRLELVTRLWRIPGLRVVPWRPGSRSAGTRPSPSELAVELGVTHVLDPALIPGAGGPVVAVQLIDAQDDEVIWAGRFEQRFGRASVATVHEEVARKTAEALSLDMGERPPDRGADPPTRSAAAYDAYVRGKALHFRGRLDDLYRAEAHFQRATELDPEFAEAWAALAQLRNFMLHFHITERTITSARRPLQRAIELAPGGVETHLAQAGLHINLLEYDAALEHIERMGELEPGSPEVDFMKGMVAMWQGRWEDAILHHLQSGRLDPQGTRAPFEVGLASLRLGRYDESDRAFERALDLDSGMPWAAAWSVVVPIKRNGDLPEARRRLAAAARNPGAWPVLFELTKHKAAELRPFARILAPDLGKVLEDTAVHRALRQRCRTCDLRLHALVAEHGGDSARARAYHDSLRTYFDGLVGGGDEFGAVGPQLVSWLALEQARTGQISSAVTNARDAQRAIPFARDAYQSTFVVEALASVYLLAGRHGDAVALLEWLLSVPSDFSPAVLRLDPMWDPLRDRSDFQRLVGRHLP